MSTSALKSSGAMTPAPTSKVLRWKDLEAAAVEAAGIGRDHWQRIDPEVEELDIM